MKHYQNSIALKTLLLGGILTVSACSNSSDPDQEAASSSQQVASEEQEDHSQHTMGSNEMGDRKPPVGDGAGEHHAGMDSAARQGSAKEGDGMNHRRDAGNMAGMNHGEGKQSQHTMEHMPGMNDMNHTDPKKDKVQSADMSGMNHQMPGMNHAPNNPKARAKEVAHPQSKPQGTDMSGMNHEKMQSQSDHKTTPHTPNQAQTHGAAHGNSMNRSHVDMNGRPLIDTTKPYDNNPAWEQKNQNRKP